MTDTHTYDITIIGGGLAGLTTAIGFAAHGFSVCVIDREKRGAQVDTGFDGRSSAIASASINLFKGIGIWDYLEGKTQPMLEIRVTDGRKPSLLHLHFDASADENCSDPLGHMIENRHMREAMFARFDALNEDGANLTLFDGATVSDIKTEQSGCTVTLESGEEINSNLLIGADGRGSMVRQHAGIGIIDASYGQVGIVCTIEHELSHCGIAHERFLPSGPFAILPLTGNRASLVWSEKEHLKDTIMGLSERAFRAEVQRRCGDFLGEVSVVDDRRWAYPLTLQYAERFTHTRTALVADAAHGMHPIAGQGLNMGLRDIAAILEVIKDARDVGLDIGSDQALAGYSEWRQFDNASLLAVTDALTRLFSNDIAPVRIARDIGIAVVDEIPPLKNFFMNHARGNVGELPKLLRGESLT